MLGVAAPSVTHEDAAEDLALGLAAGSDEGVSDHFESEAAEFDEPVLQEYDRKLGELRALSCECSLCNLSSQDGH